MARDSRAYARRNRVALGLFFAGFLLLGVLSANEAALIGGAIGMGWLIWAHLGQGGGS